MIILGGIVQERVFWVRSTLLVRRQVLFSGYGRLLPLRSGRIFARLFTAYICCAFVQVEGDRGGKTISIQKPPTA
jgi:hypothetical protein